MSMNTALAKLGLRLGVLGSAASLAIAAPVAAGNYDTDAHTFADRIGIYFDRTPTAEKMGVVVMGTERFAVDTNGITVNGRETISAATGRMDVQSDRSLVGYAVLTDNVVGIGRQVTVPVNAGDGSFYEGNVVTVTGIAGAASRNVAVGADIALTTSAGGRNALFGSAASVTGGAGVLCMALNRTGIQGNNGIAIVVGGNSTINVQTGILIGSAGGQVGNFGANRVVGLGFSVTANANDAIAIGNQANSSHSKSIALGRLAATTAANQLRIGGPTASTDQLDIVLTSTTPSTSTVTGSIVTPGGIGVGDGITAGGTITAITGLVVVSDPTPPATVRPLRTSGRAQIGNYIANNSPYDNLGASGVNAGLAVYDTNGSNNAVCGILGLMQGNANGTLKTGIAGVGRRTATTASRHIGVWGMTDNAGTNDPTYLIGVFGSDAPSSPADATFTGLSVGVAARANQTGRTAFANTALYAQARSAGTGAVVGTQIEASVPGAWGGSSLRGEVISVTMEAGAASTTATTVRGIDVSMTVNQGAALGYTGILLNVTETAIGSGSKLLLDLQVSSASRFSVSNDGLLTSTAGRIIGVQSIVSAAGTTVLTATDHFVCVTGATTETLTLPVATNGRWLLIKNRSTGTVTVNRAGADTIDGGTTINILAGNAIMLIANGTDWTVN